MTLERHETSTAMLQREHSPLEIVDEDDARYALNLVACICRSVGPGMPDSLLERKSRHLRTAPQSASP
jgi:hypothetical protein